MLREIRVKNYQSLRDVKIVPGDFTVIVGESDVGKSALVRAIKAPLINRTGQDFISDGAKQAGVALSFNDGWAVAVAEGLASGLPVISTDRTGAALEFIENNKNGWLIPAGDGDALYKAMREAALLSPEEHLKRSKDARASVSGHSLEEGVDRFHDAIMGTLDK